MNVTLDTISPLVKPINVANDGHDDAAASLGGGGAAAADDDDDGGGGGSRSCRRKTG